jgi:hypothetical protein
MSETLLTDPSAKPLAPRSSLSGASGVALWAATIFLSAFLLFQVQPILAKMILPWFGGAAGVWTTCLVFFQVAYLLGNLYAHWLTRAHRFRWASRVHVALLAASLAFLPIIPKAFWKPSGAEDPSLRILGLLAATIGLPFLLLSATSPLLQSWYTRHRVGARPYRFYALSNLGSFLALISYPVLVEPKLATRHQALVWSVGYGLFALLCATLALRQGPSGFAMHPHAVVAARPSWKLQLLWVALAADASALLLAITNHLSQNVAAVPLLWIVPLSLYLLSLVLCFEGHGWYNRFLFLRFAAVALGSMTYALVPPFGNAGPELLVPLYCSGLFICCMACHGELEKLKPEPEHLTLFYLMLSTGGALGGIFVGVAAPRLFRGLYELPIAIGACAVLLVIALRRDPSVVFHKPWHPASLASAALAAGLVVSVVIVVFRQSGDARLRVRNFYGSLHVHDIPQVGTDPARRELYNGTIVHGVEFLAAGRAAQPTAYFGPQSGAGIALTTLRAQGPIRVGIIGLGAGTLASYGQAGDRYTFYDINPLVIQIAHSDFDFLRESKAQIEIVPGDARLSLERESPRQYDILLVDAFSGDAIPIHLLTREAFELYFRHLKPGGLLAVHISNRFLDLQPVVESGAASVGARTEAVENNPDASNMIYRSKWMLVTRDGVLPAVPSGTSAVLEPPTQKPIRVWTDDYSNLLQILK